MDKGITETLVLTDTFCAYEACVCVAPGGEFPFLPGKLSVSGPCDFETAVRGGWGGMGWGREDGGG